MALKAPVLMMTGSKRMNELKKATPSSELSMAESSSGQNAWTN
jgi:hypothetical protein